MKNLTQIILVLCSLGFTLAQKDSRATQERPTYERTLVNRQAQYEQLPQYRSQPSQFSAQQPQYSAQQPQYSAQQPQYSAQQPQYSAQQPQYSAQQPQYISEQSQGFEQQVSPDYQNYLQQLQQLAAQSRQKPSPQLYNPALQEQSLQSTAPQSFQPQPVAKRPQIAQDQRALQESIVRRPIVDQEREDHRRQNLISLGIDPTALRRQQQLENLARLQAKQAQLDAQPSVNRLPASSSSAEDQLAAFFADAGPQQPVPQIQHHLVPVPQSIPVRQRQEDSPQQTEPSSEPQQRISYSQLSFGGSPLQKPRLLQPTPQQLAYQPQTAQRAAQYSPQQYSQPEQVSYDSETLLAAQRAAQRASQKQPQEKAQKIIFHSTQQASYIDPTGEQDNLPQQYLIETTKPKEQPSPVLIPRRQPFSYRPQANYQEVHASIAAQQQRAHIAQQRIEAGTTPTPPSRSAIYVTTARTPPPRTYSALTDYRIPNTSPQKSLTDAELKSLINYGFALHVTTPSPNQPDYQRYFRNLSKMQSLQPPRVGRVPVSEDQRQQMATNGFSSLYRVPVAQNRDSSVRYVLSDDNRKRDADKA